MSRAPGRTPFIGLLSGYSVSGLGTSMSAVAIPWLVLTTTGSAARMGVVGFAEMAPYVALTALGGPLVDRLGARRMTIAGNTAAALAVGTIPLLYAAGLLRLSTLVILVALGGLVRGAADNANSTLVPATAALGGIPMERAAGLFSSANNAGLLLGAPLAGVLISLFGPPSVIAGDAVSFAFAAATVAGCLPAATRPDTGERQNYFRSLAEGLRFIRGDRLLLAIATMVAVTNLLDIGLINVELPVWVRTNHGGAGTVGLLLGGFAVGGLTGALTASWLGPRLPRWKAYSFGFLIAGSPPFVVLAVFHTVPPVLVLLFVVGLAGGTLNPMLGAAQYERIPEALRARVLGAVRASAWLGVPLGSLLAGALVQGIGLHATLLATGAVFFLATLCPFVFRAWRQLDRQPADPEGPAGADQSYVDSANASSVAESAAAG